MYQRMDLLGLPSNVQRRIALLLEETKGVPATARSVSPADSESSDHVSADTSGASASPLKHRSITTPWQLVVSANDILAELRQSATCAVFTNAFGDHKLQARH